MKILIDNGHGSNTPGKCSPDRRYHEWSYTRQIAAALHLSGHKIRKDYSDGDPDQEADFYLLCHTSCPAVFTENLFMDNPADCAFLLSEEGQQALVDLHVDGIISHLDFL